MIHRAASHGALRLGRRDRRQALRALGWLTLAQTAVRVFPYSTIRRAIDRIAPRSVSEREEHAPSRPASPAKDRQNSTIKARVARLLGARSPLLRRAPRPIVAAPMTAAECERALRRALRVLPSASCLAQAIAAACLLRRAGRDSTLTIGVRFDSAHGFQAHAWLESDGIIVTGRNELFEHRVLLRDVVDRNSFTIRHV
jgi:hypothetical protein